MNYAEREHYGCKNYLTWCVAYWINHSKRVYDFATQVDSYPELVDVLKEHNINCTPDDILYNDPDLDVEYLNTVVGKC